MADPLVGNSLRWSITSLSEPVTGSLLRQTARRGPGRLLGPWRWDRVKAIFDGQELRTFLDPSGTEVDVFYLLPGEAVEVVDAEDILMVHKGALVVPLGARAEAPPSVATPAAFRLVLKSGAEVIFCADGMSERARWLRSLRAALSGELGSQPADVVPPVACAGTVDETPSNSMVSERSREMRQSAVDGSLAQAAAAAVQAVISAEDKKVEDPTGPVADPGRQAEAEQLASKPATPVAATSPKGKGKKGSKGPPLPASVSANDDSNGQKGPPMPVLGGGKGKGPPLPASVGGKGPPLPASCGKGGSPKGPPLPAEKAASGKGPPLPAGKATGKGPALPGGKATGKGPAPVAGGKGKGKGKKGSGWAGRKVPAKVHGLSEKALAAPEVSTTIFATDGVQLGELDFKVLETKDAGKDAEAKNRAFSVDLGKRLLDDKTAHRLGVILKKSDIPAMALCAEHLEPSRFSCDFRGGLEGAGLLSELLLELQDSSPLERIREHLVAGGSAAELREIERGLTALASVPRAVQRVNVFVASARLQDRMQTARQQLDELVVAISAVQTSNFLHDVVHIVQALLAWNVGKGFDDCPRAFHVGEQLLRLSSIKSTGFAKNRGLFGYSLMHWVAETMLRWGRDLPAEPLLMDVPNIDKVVHTNPTQAQEELKWVKNCHQMAQRELKDHGAAYGVPPPSSKESTTAVAEPESKDQPSVEVEPSEAAASTRASTTRSSTRPSMRASTRTSARTSCDGQPADLWRASTALLSSEVGLEKDRGDDFDGLELSSTKSVTSELVSQLGSPQKRSQVSARRLDARPAGAFAHLVPAGQGISGGSRPSTAPSGRLSGACLKQGFLWVLHPHRLRKPAFRKCWVDVRANHLILRQLRHGRVRSESAVPLPGATITPFGSGGSSHLTHWLASLEVHGFELRSADVESPLILQAESAADSERWRLLLCEEAQCTYFGRVLHARQDSKTPEPIWCIVDKSNRTLAAYTDSLDFAFGRVPRFCIDLRGAVVTPFDKADVQGSSYGGISRLCEDGFRIQAAVRNPTNDRKGRAAGNEDRVVFGCEVGDVAERWVRYLRKIAGTEEEPPADPLGEEAAKSVDPVPGERISRAALETPPQDGDMPTIPPPPRASVIPRLSTAVLEPYDKAKDRPDGSDGLSSASSDSDGDQPGPGSPLPDGTQSTATNAAAPTAPWRNLRRLAKCFASEARQLEAEVQSANCAAEAALAFFDEPAPQGKQLEAIHTFMGQLLQFSKDFKSALASVRRQQEMDAAKAAKEAAKEAKEKDKAEGNGTPTRSTAKRFSKIDSQTTPFGRRRSSAVSRKISFAESCGNAQAAEGDEKPPAPSGEKDGEPDSTQKQDDAAPTVAEASPAVNSAPSTPDRGTAASPCKAVNDAAESAATVIDNNNTATPAVSIAPPAPQDAAANGAIAGDRGAMQTCAAETKASEPAPPDAPNGGIVTRKPSGKGLLKPVPQQGDEKADASRNQMLQRLAERRQRVSSQGIAG
eukprot:TRINITY_DN7833_c0_g2_i1.p1 TRINITY_DN7833_c0_g2~~TRINITY_DN7833_c0_g2_i1.p1  ORF type:complete len:1499 (-),score=321.62 TRINITY_DN7833_c0_g2_i1:53-4549(-)